MPALVDFETIPQLFNRLASYYEGRDRTFLRYKEDDTWKTHSWEAVRRQVRQVAGYLHRAGVRKGDRVAILSENRPEWLITDLATQLLGGVNVSIYTTLPADQAAYILQNSGARQLILSRPLQQRKAFDCFDDCPDLEGVVTTSAPEKNPPWLTTWDEALNEGGAYWDEHEDDLALLAGQVEPDDLCALIYTSGTTGQPKGVMLTHRNLCSNAKAAHRRVHITDEDHHLSFLPLCHSFEHTTGYIAVMAAGATISFAESIEAISKNLPEVQPTLMISVPRLFEKMYNIVTKQIEEGSALQKRIFDWAVQTGRRAAEAKKGDGAVPWTLQAQNALAQRLVFSKLHEKLGGNLNLAVSGGAALPKQIGQFFEAAGVPVAEGYGLTETAPVLAVNPPDAPRYGTVGAILSGVTVAIRRLDDDAIAGQLSGDDHPSDLTTDEGEILVKGPNVMQGYWQDEEATRRAFDDDGWFRTGDVGRFEDGYLAITDRLGHMIVSRGGKNIYPGPIEDAFKSVPDISQILVVGEGRSFLTALIVPDLEALREHADEQGWTYDSDEELLARPEVQGRFEDPIREYGRDAAPHERIRNFALLAEPFTVENGLLTPTMKPRRRRIEERYADRIDEMYAAYA
jgi:long-chain acyl-CoA synthetase